MSVSSSTLILCVLAITSAVINGQTQLNNAYYDGAVCIESVRSSGNFIGVSRDMDRFCNIQFDIKMVTDAPACENELCFAFKNADLDTNNKYLSNELFLSDRISAASKELWYIEPASSASVLNVVPGAVNIFSVVPNQSGRTLLCRQLIRAQTELQTDNRLNRITRGCQWKLQKPTKGAHGFAEIASNDILIDTTDSEIEASDDAMLSRFKSNPLCISWTAQEFGFSPNNLQYLDQTNQLFRDSNRPSRCNEWSISPVFGRGCNGICFSLKYVRNGRYLNDKIGQLSNRVTDNELWIIEETGIFDGTNGKVTLQNQKTKEFFCVFDGASIRPTRDLVFNTFVGNNNLCHWILQD